MHIYIRDQNYKSRIKRFMQLNFSANKNLQMVDDINQLANLQSNFLLTDDQSIDRPDLNVHYLVDHMPQADNQHNKFQNFRQLINQIDHSVVTTTAKQNARMILVTSLVGGVGNSTIAENIASIINKQEQTLLLKFYAPQCSSKNTLSEFIVTQQHNRGFDLKKYVSIENGVHQLDGFFSAEELAEAVLDEVFSSVRSLFNVSTYHDIIVDAPPLPYCRALTKHVDYVYLVRSEQRFNEETQIADSMQLNLANWSQIINNAPFNVKRGLPSITNHTAFQAALTDILIEDGLYEY